MGWYQQMMRQRQRQQPAATAAPDPQIAVLRGDIASKSITIGDKEAAILRNQGIIAGIQSDLLSETLTSAQRLEKINDLNTEIIKLNANIKQLEGAYQTVITDYTTLSSDYTSLNSDYDTALDAETNLQIELYKNIMSQNAGLEK